MNENNPGGLRWQQSKWPRLAAIQEVLFLQRATLLPNQIENGKRPLFS